MMVPSLRRPIAAWSCLVDLVSAVTEPPANVAQCDERVGAVAADSAIARALSATADAWRRASGSSAVVAAYRRNVRPLVPVRLADRVRAVGCVTATASATTLILRTGATDRDPLTWALPATVGIVAVVAILGSESIARAIANKHS